jgi:hypothetical protein
MKAAWPSEARIVEAFGRADVTIASFRDGRVILCGLRIVPLLLSTSAYSTKADLGSAIKIPANP